MLLDSQNWYSIYFPTLRGRLDRLVFVISALQNNFHTNSRFYRVCAFGMKCFLIRHEKNDVFSFGNIIWFADEKSDPNCADIQRFYKSKKSFMFTQSFCARRISFDFAFIQVFLFSWIYKCTTSFSDSLQPTWCLNGFVAIPNADACLWFLLTKNVFSRHFPNSVLFTHCFLQLKWRKTLFFDWELVFSISRLFAGTCYISWFLKIFLTTLEYKNFVRLALNIIKLFSSSLKAILKNFFIPSSNVIFLFHFFLPQALFNYLALKLLNLHSQLNSGHSFRQISVQKNRCLTRGVQATSSNPTDEIEMALAQLFLIHNLHSSWMFSQEYG